MKVLAELCGIYLQITSYLPLARERSPDGATTNGGVRHLIAAYYSFIDAERMKGRLPSSLTDL